MGIPMEQMVVWDPYMINGGVDPARLKGARVILWKGHCSVHQRFLPQHVDRIRAEEPGMKVIVHPECRWEVCQKADALGSTEKIIEYIEQAPAGSSFAVGTEIHLVNRLAARFAPLGKRVITLDDAGCLCTTMYRISPAHLAWALENLVTATSSTASRSRQTPSTGPRSRWTGCSRFALNRRVGAGRNNPFYAGWVDNEVRARTGLPRLEEQLSKVFTLAEAQVLVPVLGSLVRRAREAAVRASELENEMQELGQRIFLSGGMHVDVSAAARRRAERDKSVQDAKSTLLEVEEIGATVRDLNDGALELPSLLEGRPVLLCWTVGESEITHWRELEDEQDVLRDLDPRFGRGERPN